MATLTPWNPFRALELATTLAKPGATTYTPALDVLERDGKLHVRIDAPGLDKDEISLEVKDNRLVISGERRVEESVEGDRHWHFERSFGAFRRVVALPRGIDQATASASYENGVLEVVLELPRKPEPLKISIS